MGERTVVVTGANTGIGRATASALAGEGWRVYVAARSRVKGEAAVAGIRAATGSSAVFFLALDLADLESVRACAAEFLGRGEPVQVLVNNAGVGGVRGLTRQGFELMFGVNHLGHFLLTQLLLERLTSSGPARVVTVSSDAHYNARGIDWDGWRGGPRGPGFMLMRCIRASWRRTSGGGCRGRCGRWSPGACSRWIRARRRRCTARRRPRWPRTPGCSTTGARCGRPARWPRPSWAGHYGSGARRGPPFKLGQWIFPSTRR